MTPEERRRLAIQAAVDVAEEFGIDVERPRVLKDSNNTIVHLAPAAVVAKVGTSHFRKAKLESLERELAVAAYLVEREAPVAAPARDVAPRPHRLRSLTLTLWQYPQPVAGGEPEQDEVAAALKAVHVALAGFPGALPPFSLELEDARRLLRPDRSSALAPADRSLLCGVLDEVQAALPALVSDSRPLHGSPHSGNWVRTARGLLLLDFETACRGPLEWDLAALDDAALTRPDALRLRPRVATREPLGHTQRRATLHVGDLAVAEGDHLEALLPAAVGGGPSSGADDRVLTDLAVLRLHLDAPRAPLLDLEPQDLTGLVWAASGGRALPPEMAA